MLQRSAQRTGRRSCPVGGPPKWLSSCHVWPLTPAAGILILLYGLRTVDLLSLRREQLIQRGADHYLEIGAAPLLLPHPWCRCWSSYRCTATTTAPSFRRQAVHLRCCFQDSATPNHRTPEGSGTGCFSPASTFEEDATPPDLPWPATYPHRSWPTSSESTTSPQPAGHSEPYGTCTSTWHNGGRGHRSIDHDERAFAPEVPPVWWTSLVVRSGW